MQSMKYLRTTILILLLFAGACDDRGWEFIDMTRGFRAGR